MLEPPGSPVCSTLSRSWSSGDQRLLARLELLDSIYSPPPPPIVLIPKILMQRNQDKATGLLIAPHWHSQPWFPNLMEMLVYYSARLPALPATILLPFTTEELHSLWKTLQLAVWPISGVVSRQLDFQRKCAKLSWQGLHNKDMKDHGKYG